MTRINCIPAEYLLDEHLLAAHREGLRPQNEILSGKINVSKAPANYKLGAGHVLFCRKHLVWTNGMFDSVRSECLIRGFNINPHTSDLSDIPPVCLNDYTPTKQNLRHNLARICERWRKRKKAYHWNGEIINDVATFRVYLSVVKEDLKLNKNSVEFL